MAATSIVSLPPPSLRLRLLRSIQQMRAHASRRLAPLRKLFAAPPYTLEQLHQHIVTEGALYPEIQRQLDPRSIRALREKRAVPACFRDSSAQSPPPQDLIFFSVCNDKYAPGLEALLLSLLAVYPNLENRYVVYHDGGLSEFSRERLLSIYPHLEFFEKDPQSYRVQMSHYVNHQRVGLLGYLSLEALALHTTSHVVILDSDLLVLDDISALWEGDRIKAVPDIGHRPFGVIAQSTGRPVINSGVLSFPASELGEEAVERAHTLLRTIDQNTDPDLLRFADQKFWNIYLADKDVELLPQNLNTIKTLLQHHYRSELGRIQILHLTGPKPWYSFLNSELLGPEELQDYRQSAQENSHSFALWEQNYLRNITRARLRHFREQCGAELDELRYGSTGRPVALIGNGPSLRTTDLSLFRDYEKIVFNWFVHHEDFDTIAPDHLVLASHLFFGGWHTPHPQIPKDFLEVLLSRRHRPRLWAPFYFKPFLDKVDELREFQISYFLYEKPLRRDIAYTGVPELDLYHPLIDCHTGVLTCGVPLALHRGARQIVLVGCDSNYSSQTGSYFYPAEKHTTRSTKTRSLLRTWAARGAGPLGYRIVARALQDRGVQLWDATVNGQLHFLQKLPLDRVESLALEAHQPGEALENLLNYPSAAE